LSYPVDLHFADLCPKKMKLLLGKQDARRKMRERRKKAQKAARQYARNMATIAMNNIRMRELKAIMARDAIEASEARTASALEIIKRLDAAINVLASSGWGLGVNPGNTDEDEDTDEDTDEGEDEDEDDTDDTDDTDEDEDTDSE
jgi:hypothetical protein